LVKYNIQTIYFHMLFSIIYMIILANFNWCFLTDLHTEKKVLDIIY
jgi:hypothetical protein